MSAPAQRNSSSISFNRLLHVEVRPSEYLVSTLEKIVKSVVPQVTRFGSIPCTKSRRRYSNVVHSPFSDKLSA
jgi:hypothetical protein